MRAAEGQPPGPHQPPSQRTWASRWARLRLVRRLVPLWTLREIRVQYRQSAIDVGWSLLTPVITLVGFGFILTRAFGVDGDGVPYITFAWAGVVLWTFMANALLRGSTSLVASADLVRKVAFPKEVVPLATVLAAALDLAIGLVSLAVLMVIQGVGVTITAIAAIPVLAALVVWTTALAIAFATVTAFVRDVSHGLAVLLRIGIFVTPVMYPVSEIPDRFEWLVNANPIAVFIESLRDALLRDTWPDWTLLGLHSLVAVVLLVAAWEYVQRVEGRIADVI